MTTIISRLYSDAKTANAAAAALKAAGMPASSYDVISAGAGNEMDMMRAARVGDASARAYLPRIARGNSLLVARAPVTPFGYARKVMDIVDGFDSIHVPDADPNEYVREEMSTRYSLSVLTNHPRFFTQDLVPGSGNWPGLVTAAFGMRMLSRHREKRSAISGTRYMSRAFWPGKLLSTKERRSSVISGGMLITERLGIPTLARKNGVI